LITKHTKGEPKMNYLIKVQRVFIYRVDADSQFEAMERYESPDKASPCIKTGEAVVSVTKETQNDWLPEEEEDAEDAED